jgi:hypothetical protein
VRYGLDVTRHNDEFYRPWNSGSCAKKDNCADEFEEQATKRCFVSVTISIWMRHIVPFPDTRPWQDVHVTDGLFDCPLLGGFDNETEYLPLVKVYVTVFAFPAADIARIIDQPLSALGEFPSN